MIRALLLLVLSSTSIAQEVYKEVGEDGVPVFSDQGTADNKPLELRETMTFSDPLARQRIQAKEEEKAAKAIAPNYQLEILAPTSGTAIRQNAGNLTLTVAISPSPQPGHRVDLIMDGSALQQIAAAGEINLTNLDRGTHDFSLRVTDEKGKTISESESASITILRHSKLQPRPRSAP